MLSIILLILKVLGILLLVILSIVFLILALVLFAPIRYCGKGSKYCDGLLVQARVTYLNPIVRVFVEYPGAHIVQVKICGFTVFKTGKASEEEEQHEKTKESTKDDKKEKTKPSHENNTAAEQECQHQGGKESSQAKEEGSPQQSSISTAREQKTESTQSITSESSDASHSDGQKEQDTTKDSVLDTVGYYASLFQENKGLILEVLKTVLRALKTILPRKCRIKAVFGTGEADKTGFIYAAYCALEGYLPGEIILEPVWTEKFLEGEFELKGKIRFIHFLVATVKIIANRRVRLLIKKIRRV